MARATTSHETVRRLAPNGEISAETYVIDHEGTDRKGNYLLKDIASDRRVRAHPSTVLPVNDDGAPVSRSEDNTCLIATCPKCDKEVTVDISPNGDCSDCGPFALNWRDMDSSPIPIPEAEIVGKARKPIATRKIQKLKVVKQLQAPTAIDFKKMKRAGEIWTKSNIDFDYPDFDVRAHVFLMVSGRARKLCFNSYNGTFGKKDKAEEVAAFIADKPHGGKTVGFYVRNTPDQERKKLQKAGYVREN